MERQILINFFTVLFLAACSSTPDETDTNDSNTTDTNSNPADTDSTSGTASDTTTDTGIPEGELCTVSVSSFSIFGNCGADAAQCEGGTWPLAPQGTCADGLVCCINTLQCVIIGGTCQASQCDILTGSIGYQIACPNHGYCCIEIDGGLGLPDSIDAGK